MSDTNQPYILLISGSPRRGGRTRGLADAIHAMLGRMQVQTSLHDLSEHVLPLYNGEDAQGNDPEVQLLRQEAERADGFVILSPEYHAAMSGALKNALDFLGSVQFRNKPTSIAAAAGGGKGGVNALNNMRTTLRGIYALVLPDQFIADPPMYDDTRVLVHPLALERLQLQMEELVKLCRLLAASRSRPG